MVWSGFNMDKYMSDNIKTDLKIQENTARKSTDLNISIIENLRKLGLELTIDQLRDIDPEKDIPGFAGWDHERQGILLRLQVDALNLLTPEEMVVRELNRKHAVIHTDQFYILTEKENPVFGGIDFTLESKQSFKNQYENKLITCSNGRSRTKADVWLKSSNRREFNGINFTPHEVAKASKCYNLWKGFSKIAKQGDCSKYWSHVRDNICSGDGVAYRYVRKWCAYLFQHPNEVHTALVLCGSQGVGKNSFVEPLGVLLGSHYVLLSNIQELVSNFNYHLKHAVLIHANEALWGGHKKEIGTLKAMITEKTCLIEGKGKDRIMVKNFKHIILSSNEEWPVHLDHDDRRFFVLRVSENHKEDHTYFAAVQEQLDRGGYEALLYDLLHEDLIVFNPRELPNSEAAFSIKIRSSDSIHKYIYEALKDGCFDIGNVSPNGIWKTLPVDSVFNDYCCWYSKNGEKGVIKDIFSRHLLKVMPSITISRPRSRSGNGRTKMYVLPDITDAREDFQKFYKAGSSIWND